MRRLILPSLCQVTRLSETASHLAHASAARSAAGRLVRETFGLATADICGTRLTQAEFAQDVCTSGRKLSAFPADAGRGILTGTLKRERDLTERSWTSCTEGERYWPWEATSFIYSLRVTKRYPRVLRSLISRGMAAAVVDNSWKARMCV